MKTAVEVIEPSCPDCLQKLQKPEFWSELQHKEKFQRFNVFCSVCKQMVLARFLNGGFD